METRLTEHIVSMTEPAIVGDTGRHVQKENAPTVTFSTTIAEEPMSAKRVLMTFSLDSDTSSFTHRHLYRYNTFYCPRRSSDFFKAGCSDIGSREHGWATI